MTSPNDATSDVDWDALHARLAAATARRAGAAADARRVLDDRARALARPAAAAGDDGAARATDALLVRRGATTWAVRLGDVAEVVRRAALTALPGADAPVVAVLPWRGRMLAVVDLASGSALPDAALVVVAAVAGAFVGLVADAADEVRAIADADVHPPAADAPPTIAGTTADGLALLDVGRLLPRQPVRRPAPSSANPAHP